jgi:tetratricopeptide (TPR) repeat protein
MPSASEIDIKKRIRPLTYSLGIYIVGVFVFIQILALISIFWFRQVAVKIESEGPRLNGKVLSESTYAHLNLTNSARLSIEPQNTKESQILDLNEKAREMRRQNQIVEAEKLLHQALDLDPKHASTLIQLATLEEYQGSIAKALEYWQRLLDSTTPNDSNYDLAHNRVMILQARLDQERQAHERENLILRPVRKFYIDRIISMPDIIPPRPAEVQFDFLIKTNQENLDSGKMRIQVFFYDKINGNDLIPARIEAHFLDPKPKWQLGIPETLRVKYIGTSDPTRSYFGYLIRLIYNDEVQDERAEPFELLNLFPYAPKK